MSVVTLKWLLFWHVSLLVHLHNVYCNGCLKKEVYRRVGKEKHCLKMITMETS
jgi:hypothetical protein